jgi:RNA polymerase sigma factor (sigma-70 family)
MQCLLDVMQTKSDAGLLREYAVAGSEAAFRELVARHSNLVWSAARRQVEDAELARDIAQSVFIDLARKARGNPVACSEEAGLAPWLFRSTRYAALRVLRDDRRRKNREKEAMETLAGSNDEPDAWDRVGPALDEAMSELGERDRRALLLRFFENRDLRSVGRALGVSENAAQKRLVRALEKLRRGVARRGAGASATALATALSGHAVQAAPAGFAASAASAGLAASTAATGLNTLLCKIMALTKIQTGAVCVALIAAPLAWQWRAQAQIGNRIADARDSLTTAKNALAGLQSEFGDTQAGLARAPGEAAAARRRLDDLERQRSKSAAQPAQAAYHWGDDQPLARVSKNLLHQIQFRSVRSNHGDLTPEARELLQLTGPEADQTSAAIAQFLATVRQAEAARLTLVDPTAAELAGRPPDQVRVFAVGDIKPQFVEARTQLMDSLQGAMGDDRLGLFQQGLGGWISLTEPGELDMAMAVYPGAKRVIVGEPGPGDSQPSFGWSVSVLSTPGANGLNWAMDVNDVPEPYQSQLTDWIAQAKAPVPAQPSPP